MTARKDGQYSKLALLPVNKINWQIECQEIPVLIDELKRGFHSLWELKNPVDDFEYATAFNAD